MPIDDSPEIKKELLDESSSFPDIGLATLTKVATSQLSLGYYSPDPR